MGKREPSSTEADDGTGTAPVEDSVQVPETMKRRMKLGHSLTTR